MAYLTANDFRTATLAEYAAGLALTSTEAADPALTAAIARLSKRLDGWTKDHFESESGATLLLDVRGASRQILLPKRTTAVTQVATRDADGTFTVEAATAYRLVSSLNDDGDEIVRTRSDRIEIIETKTLADGSATWPEGPEVVRVTGAFGWSSTPADIKRAVALLVYDNFKPFNDSLRRARIWETGETRITMGETRPSGLPEVDDIVAAFTRHTSAVAA